MRKAWLSLAGVTAVALLAVQFAWQGDAPEARALDSRVPMAAPATEGETLPSGATPEPALLLGPDLPMHVRGTPTHICQALQRLLANPLLTG